MMLTKIDPDEFHEEEILTYRVDMLLAKINEAIDVIRNIQAVIHQNTTDIATLETRIESDID